MEDRSIKLGNLYLHHAIAFVYDIKVVNSQGESEEPNENLMRFIESESKITERECVEFRKLVVAHLSDFRMDHLYQKLQTTLDLIVDVEESLVEKWFETYPIILPLMAK